MQTYTKINTLYKRFQSLSKAELPKKDWIRFQNVIKIEDYSNPVFELLNNTSLECYSKIDGTNSKIAYFPSTGKIMVGGKTDNASSQSGQFEFLQKIADRILPKLKEMYPPECAKFTPKKDEENKICYYSTDSENPFVMKAGKAIVELEEVPVYIYGEYYGKSIQKCGARYRDDNDFAVFDICQQGWWFPKEMRDSICQILNLHQVPFIGYLTLEEAEEMVTKGFPTYENAKDPTLIEEGIVARPKIPFKDTKGNRVIVKIKHCDYVKWKNAFDAGTEEDYLDFVKWYNENIEN